MNKLTVFADDDSSRILETMNDSASIADKLAVLNIGFAQWPTPATLNKSDGQAEVLVAYRKQVKELCEKFDFKTVDVAAVTPDHPQLNGMREKFLSEHTHDDYEARFFVDGSGMFYIHQNGCVYMLHCQKGDLINLPAHTPHWFDMGAKPSFKAIRFFRIDEGWVGHATGSDIASHFPLYEPEA